MFDGQKMRVLRKKKGLTTVQLSQIVGVSDSYISMLERGKRESPEGLVVFKISQALDCLPGDLTDSKIALAFAGSVSENNHDRQPASKIIYPETSEPTATCQNCHRLEAEVDYLRGALTKAQDLSAALAAELSQEKNRR